MDDKELRSKIQSLIKGYDSKFIISEIFVIGSRGAKENTENSDLDLLISVEYEDEFSSEEEFSEKCNRLQTFLSLEKATELIEASGIDTLSKTHSDIDIMIFPTGIANYELQKFMEHGGYQDAYVLTESCYMSEL